MKAIALHSGRSGGSPGVRLGLALAASLVLHVALLLPAAPWRRAIPPPLPPPPTPPLLATLAVPALATHPEEAAAVVAAPAVPPLAADPSAPAGKPPVPKPAAAGAPKPLTGRALDTAIAALVREEFYPRAAIERGLEGRVVLLLTLSAAGAVTAVDIASTSGHAMLDEAALHAAGRIGALPGGSRQVLLPVEFRLE